jgi:hypothetical protein
MISERDKLFILATSNGCRPFFHDGLIGPAWHCGCADQLHAYDGQCSAISQASARRQRPPARVGLL